MGLFNKIFRSKTEKRTTFRNPAQWFSDWLTGGGESSAGVNVNESNSLKYTPFWAAVRIISGTLGSLPIHVYRKINEKENEKYSSHPVYKLLHDRPNDYIDAVTFLETRQAHVLGYGNCYAEIQRDGRGNPLALWPLMPDKTRRMITDSGVFYYEVTLPTGGKVNIPDYNVLHIKGLGFDGYTGYNVVQMHKEALGYGMAVKKFGAKFFANGCNVSGVFEHPKELSQEAYDRLDKSLREKYTGLTNAQRTLILEEDMKFKQTGIEPEKAQALEVQKWTVDDCSRIFQIPPHMLASMEFSKYNNIEQLELEFYKRTMLYWFRKWECELKYKLFGTSERDKFFVKFNIDALLRGDIKSRMEAHEIGIRSSILSPDEAREKEDMNPIPDGKGKIFLQPLANGPLGTEPKSKDTNNNSNQNNNDPVRNAHRNLLTSQWIRVINKQNGDHRKNIDSAFNLLIEPVTAFASVIRKQNEAREILKGLLEEIITEKTKLSIYDANRMADLTINRFLISHHEGHEVARREDIIIK